MAGNAQKKLTERIPQNHFKIKQQIIAELEKDSLWLAASSFFIVDLTTAAEC